jgi:hypothetical protein
MLPFAIKKYADRLRDKQKDRETKKQRNKESRAKPSSPTSSLYKKDITQVK